MGVPPQWRFLFVPEITGVQPEFNAAWRVADAALAVIA